MALELVQLPQLRQAPTSGWSGGLIVTCMQVVELGAITPWCFKRCGLPHFGPPPILPKKVRPFPNVAAGWITGIWWRAPKFVSFTVREAWRVFFLGGRGMTSLRKRGVESHKSWVQWKLTLFLKGNDHIGDTPRLPLYYAYGRKGVNYETNLIVLLVCRTVFFCLGIELFTVSAVMIGVTFAVCICSHDWSDTYHIYI